MNAINVVGNAVLIYAFKMDVVGVAIPTMLSRMVAAALVLWLLSNSKFDLNISGIRFWKYQKEEIKNIISIGLPSSIENGMFHFGRLVLFSVISTLGTASIAANAIGNTLCNFQVFAGMAINMGLTTIVSQCVGAGDYSGVRYYTKKIAIALYALLAMINIMIFALLPGIMNLYASSAEAETIATQIAFIHGTATMVLWPTSFMLPTVLRAAGDARFTMRTSTTTMWLIRVLLAVILGKYLRFGVIGVWLAQSCFDYGTRSVIFLIRYHRKEWTTKSIKS